MAASDLRHAICSHFLTLLTTFDLNKDYNSVMLAHFPKGKLPPEWSVWLTKHREDSQPDDLDAWIKKKYPDKSAFQRVDKLKVWFGGKIYTNANLAVTEVTKVWNPMWKPPLFN